MAIDIPEDLSSEEREQRRVGWLKIRQQNKAEKTQATRIQLRELADKFAEESDKGVKQVALGVLIRLLSWGPEQQLKASSTKQKLADWFWRPFDEPSFVISAFDPKYRRRDEIAVTELARHLSKRDFPNVDFRVIPLGYADWGDALKSDRGIEAVCVIGRLGMYGPQAIRDWGTDKTRLRFPLEERPAGLRTGKLHPEFHRITESHGPVRGDTPYVAQENQKERTDYGLVQRYTAWFDARPITVVLCAGCTGLGTFGAVQWMIELSRMPIEFPKGVPQDACMEALIEVKADRASFPRHWHPKPKRLLRLLLGDQQWLQEETDWLHRAPSEIRVVYDQDGRPSEVFLDGEATGPRRDADIFRLLVRLAELTDSDSEQPVKVSTLAAMEDIWSTNPTKEVDARRRVGHLRKQYLGRALSIQDASLRLDAKIVLDRP